MRLSISYLESCKVVQKVDVFRGTESQLVVKHSIIQTGGEVLQMPGTGSIHLQASVVRLKAAAAPEASWHFRTHDQRSDFRTHAPAEMTNWTAVSARNSVTSSPVAKRHMRHQQPADAGLKDAGARLQETRQPAPETCFAACAQMRLRRAGARHQSSWQMPLRIVSLTT